MGKSSNKRKSARREPALVNVYSKGGITVRSKNAFPPELTPSVVHAFRNFINDQVELGMTTVVEIQHCGHDIFDFTMASTTNPQLGDADVLTWAWGAASGPSLRRLVIEWFSSPRSFPSFFEILPHQLELVDEGSDLCLIGTEIFTMFARYLVALGVVPDLEKVLANNAKRACAVFRNVMAEKLADQERVLISEATWQESEPSPSQKSQPIRL